MWCVGSFFRSKGRPSPFPPETVLGLPMMRLAVAFFLALPVVGVWVNGWKIPPFWMVFITHTIHVCYIYLLFLMVKYGFHVGKYTSPMDGMGKGCHLQMFRFQGGTVGYVNWFLGKYLQKRAQWFLEKGLLGWLVSHLELSNEQKPWLFRDV